MRPQAKSQNTVDYLLHIIPATVVGAFSEGEILQVLFISILFAFALHMAGERGKPVLSVIDSAAHVFFGIVGIVMRAAPLGAFGAMAFTIGKYGIGSLVSLAELMAAFYTTCLIFIFGVLGTIARLTGFSILALHPLHQRGAPDRARHLLLRGGVAADDRQAGEFWGVTSRSSVS